MTALRVGLTGGLASGKSTVARLLAEAGCEVVDADREVAELYAAGGAGAKAVSEIAGTGVLAADGAVDRQALATRLFADDMLRAAVEAAVHPLVRRRFEERAAASDAEIVVLEATLLVEAGFGPAFDLVVTVEADADTRLARAVARGLTAEQAQARLMAQGDGATRRAGAQVRIDNDGSLADLEAAVERLLADLAARLGTKPGTAAADIPGFVLVTGNPGKLAETERLLGRQVDSIAVDLPEIQSLDLAAVLSAKADEAARHTERPFVVEETGLELDALNGFPGPLVKWMLEAVGAEGIARVGLDAGRPGVTARCRLLYRDGGRQLEAEGTTRGTLVLPGRGSHGFGWDPVFLPDGSHQTYGELTDREKDRFSHRGAAWRRLIQLLAPEPSEAEPVE